MDEANPWATLTPWPAAGILRDLVFPDVVHLLRSAEDQERYVCRRWPDSDHFGVCAFESIADAINRKVLDQRSASSSVRVQPALNIVARSFDEAREIAIARPPVVIGLIIFCSDGRMLLHTVR